MTAHLLGTWPAGSPEWHEARTGKMTGSRIAAAAGLSPYESPFSLFYRMRGEIGEVETTPVMEWGTRLEDAIFQKFLDNHPELEVTKTGTWQNDDRPWQTGNPDGLIAEDGLAVSPTNAILEVKTARYDDGWGTQGTDEIPLHYKIQVWWYLDTLGLSKAYVAVLIGGSDYREYVVEHSEEDCRELRNIAQTFLGQIKRNERPDIDADSATYTAIKELHPLIDGSTVDVADDTGRAVISARNSLNDAAELDQLARSVLADEMGDAKYAYWRGVKLADRRCKKAEGSVPYAQLVNNLPSINLEPAS